MMIFTFHISLKVDEFSLCFFSELFKKDTTIRHKSMKAEGQTASFFQMMHNCKYAIGLMGKPTKKERLFYNPTNAIRFNNAIHRCIWITTAREGPDSTI